MTNKHSHAFGKGTTFPLLFNRQIPLYRLRTFIMRHLIIWLESAEANESIESFIKGAIIADDFRIGPDAWCVNKGPRENIQVGRNVICRGILRCENWTNAQLIIGDKVYIGDDCLISCSNRIEIGSMTLLAHGVQIFDNDSHPVNPFLREQDYQAVLEQCPKARSLILSSPIKIGERAWIGFNAIILKGIEIGEGSVVAAGSVVATDVPPYTIVAGNPAKVVRQIDLI